MSPTTIAAGLLALLALCALRLTSAAPPPIQCDVPSPVRCRDTCTNSNSPCAKNPLVDCVVNPCTVATYLGTRLVNMACQPIYVSKATGKVVTNCNKPLPPPVCTPGSATVNCFADPCTVTTASCKGDNRYVCLGSYCDELTYLGTNIKNAGCLAIFVDPLTRTVVKRCIDEQR